MSPLYGRLFYHVIRTAIAQIKLLWKASKFDSNTANKDDLNPSPNKVQAYVLAPQHDLSYLTLNIKPFVLVLFKKALLFIQNAFFTTTYLRDIFFNFQLSIDAKS